ncbi:unnamed protein product [Adineta steineri]|uniref:O-methyltransferase dimerisation domain-containing protein n=1 Tax=Adineta steineri TaxID=433720 RepID=A0A814KY94_9BILA|nr:unnamed protein product [Adineta steineri]CAF1057315.1 unnamed protein product [Adineta steineri]CAF3579967.1 unnamed protein product [Adineta steineri]CAF3587762.1 unnamed protein product [Adineta steineri]
MTISIYDSEQYLFEIAQSFIRSRVIFTSIELKIFDLLLSYNDGLTCLQISEQLTLHYIENESRCLQDILDCLTSMKFLERDNEKLIYKLTKFTRNILLPHRRILSNIDQEFYNKMPQFNDIVLNSSLKDSINLIMVLRIKQLVDLSLYTNISIDSIDKNVDVIIIWRQDGLLKEKIKQAYDILPLNKKSLLILIIPNDEYDEVTLTLNLFLNMTTPNKEQENSKEFYSKKFLKQIGFRSTERMQSTDGLQLLLAYK